MGYSLLLDSSNTKLTVGILKDNHVVYDTSFDCWQRQSELMIPEIEKALKETGCSLLDMEEVICGKGPGSYTGVRIALTIAKIICQMGKAKLILISSLRIMGDKNKKYIALMNARSSRSYIGVYDKDKVVLEDCVMTNQEVLDYIAMHHEYEVIGECEYLKIDSTLPNIINGLKSFKEVVPPYEEVLKAKPVYLKENYDI